MSGKSVQRFVFNELVHTRSQREHDVFIHVGKSPGEWRGVHAAEQQVWTSVHTSATLTTYVAKLIICLSENWPITCNLVAWPEEVTLACLDGQFTFLTETYFNYIYCG